MGTSYLVTGAKLRCMWGSTPGTLVISEGHNVIAGGRPKANCSDSRKGENIPDSVSYTHSDAADELHIV